MISINKLAGKINISCTPNGEQQNLVEHRVISLCSVINAVCSVMCSVSYYNKNVLKAREIRQSTSKQNKHFRRCCDATLGQESKRENYRQSQVCAANTENALKHRQPRLLYLAAVYIHSTFRQGAHVLRMRRG